MKGTGLVYRNPKPHVRSRHAYFPSVVNLGKGELLCSFMVGEAFESADSRIFVARSRDHGETWTLEGRMLTEPTSGSFSESCRLARCPDGSLVANVFRCDRRRADEGLANPDTLGFVETNISIYRSTDKGRTWTGPEPIDPPIVGPEFELCSPIVQLHDGKWLMPTSTWKAWDGFNPTGMKAVAFVSHDQGKSWPQYVDVLDGTRHRIIYWEHKIVELQPGHLLAVGWARDDANNTDLPNTYSVSQDGGSSFSAPRETDLRGQTAALISLGKDRVLCVYRRVKTPGLWAAEVSVRDNVWKTERQFALWETLSIVTGKHSENMVKQFNVLRFGAPCLTQLESGDMLVAFWCVEDCVSNIRWIMVG